MDPNDLVNTRHSTGSDEDPKIGVKFAKKPWIEPGKR